MTRSNTHSHNWNKRWNCWDRSFSKASLPPKAAGARSRYERSTQASPNFGFVGSSLTALRSLPRKNADGQSAFAVPTAHSADKLAQMTIEGDVRLHELILAGRADVAVLR